MDTQNATLILAHVTTIEAAIRDYLLDLGIGQSKETVDTYGCALRRFCAFLETVDVPQYADVKTLGVAHALQFARWLNPNTSKSTLKTYLAAISRFYNFLMREELIEVSTTQLMRFKDAYHNYRRGHGRRLPKLPSPVDVAQVLAQVHGTATANTARRELIRLRNIAIFEALKSSGMRVAELTTLTRADLNAETQSAIVVGKGDKERVVYFDADAWEAIRAYLIARDGGALERNSLPVFARHDRSAAHKTEPMTTETVRQLFKALVKSSGTSFKLTPHSMRHAFATKMLDATGDLALVQDLLGHSSPETTRVYAKISPTRLLAAHRLVFGEQAQAGAKLPA